MLLLLLLLLLLLKGFENVATKLELSNPSADEDDETLDEAEAVPAEVASAVVLAAGVLPPLVATTVDRRDEENVR